MERHLVTVGDRQVHYARAGRGRPVVLLHASPGTWRPLRALAEELARRFAVYALDTPGHGGSDPLPVAEPAMADYADALDETLAALGLDRVHLYGTHTGAKIALTLAVTRPDRVASLVLDGLGVSTPEERADQLANYLPPVVPRGDGTHLVAAWHQVRNMFLFWPWYDERAGARLPGTVPPPQHLHDVTAGLLDAGDAYPLAYRAAFTCDPVPLLGRLAVPSLVLAASDDPLHAHLDRIPEPAARIRIEGRVAGDDSPRALAARVCAHAAEHPDGVTDAPAPPPVHVAGALTRRYVPTRLGQVLVRWTGPEGTGRPLVVLPPAPASGRAAEEVLRQVKGVTGGRLRPAFAVDLPGTGDSDLRADPDTHLGVDLADVAGAVEDVLDALGPDSADLYGTGAGGTIAAAVAARDRARAHALALAAPYAGGTPGDRLAARTPSLAPDDHGTHLLRAWHLLRDGALRAGGRERFPDPVLLHDRVLDIVRAWPTYGAAFRAAVLGAATSRTESPHTPVVVVDPIWDPFASGAEAAPPSPYGDGRGGVLRMLEALDEVRT